MHSFIYTTLAVATPFDSLIPMIFKKYGLEGGVIVSLIAIIWVYQRNEGKRIELEVGRDKDMKKMVDEVTKLSGVVDQMQRENEKNSAEMEKAFDELSREREARRHDADEIKREHTEIKTQLREISRDVNRGR